MSDLLTDALPTVWHGRRIDPDFRHMVRLSAAYSHGEVEADPVAFALQLCGQFYTERFSPSDLQENTAGSSSFTAPENRPQSQQRQSLPAATTPARRSTTGATRPTS